MATSTCNTPDTIDEAMLDGVQMLTHHRHAFLTHLLMGGGRSFRHDTDGNANVRTNGRQKRLNTSGILQHRTAAEQLVRDLLLLMQDRRVARGRAVRPSHRRRCSACIA